MSKDAVADQSDKAADQNAGGHSEGVSLG
jgi:hypothetical protein